MPHLPQNTSSLERLFPHDVQYWSAPPPGRYSSISVGRDEDSEDLGLFSSSGGYRGWGGVGGLGDSEDLGSLGVGMVEVDEGFRFDAMVVRCSNSGP